VIVQIHFLYGTETSTAEYLCDDLQDALPDGIESDISSMADVDPSELEAGPLYVIVQSTIGSGDVAGTGFVFYEKLQNDRPDLSNVRFAIFGLGDRTFSETYNHGSEKVMTEMLACKAGMVGERGLFDASAPEMPEDIALPWMETILAECVEA
jgi:flavodoxin